MLNVLTNILLSGLSDIDLIFFRTSFFFMILKSTKESRFFSPLWSTHVDPVKVEFFSNLWHTLS